MNGAASKALATASPGAQGSPGMAASARLTSASASFGSEATRERRLLMDLFHHALQRVDPLLIVPQHLPPRPRGRTVVVGAGKASARMALALESEWEGPLSGLVVTRYGHAEACKRIGVLEAGHPVPDAAAHDAASRMLMSLRDLGPQDLVISLMSGGGSSLLALPKKGVTLEDKQSVARELLRCGASIHEINTVRTTLSAIKGGRLAQACGAASLVTIVISDVPGDDPTVVSSGPTVGVPRDIGKAALDVIERYGIALPPHVLAAIRSHEGEHAVRECGPRTVKTIATADHALAAAKQRAAELGLDAMVLGSRIEGEAREVGRVHAGIALGAIDSRRGTEHRRPLVVLSGGETTVTVAGDGRGGRNAEFLLGFALGCVGQGGVHALACDTDGIDGSQDNAGAFADGRTVERARAWDMDARAMLARNDAYTVFEALDDLVVTGPTRTNVNDFRAVLIE
jgi:glycerate 2-kinase